ncbi:hypothetical protein GCM10022216_07530 [Sphingobacterium kyonggiense]|uniref:Uncharacterized protein n=1 Tax=Sphingobacterium kyonggiense TaxID=714075 RepID=A0ABP7YDB6_9SPHI
MPAGLNLKEVLTLKEPIAGWDTLPTNKEPVAAVGIFGICIVLTTADKLSIAVTFRLLRFSFFNDIAISLSQLDKNNAALKLKVAKREKRKFLIINSLVMQKY